MNNLPRNAEALHAALSAMPVGVSWATLADQKVIFTNRKFTEIFGYTLDDLGDIASWIAAYPFAEDRESANAKWGAYFAAPQHTSEFVVEPAELRVRCKDGSIKTILNSGVILPETGWALAVFVDISDRKRDELLIREGERVARENQAIHRLLLDHSPEMIILSPFDASRRYVSPAVKGITGFTAEEYLALQGSDIVHPLDRPQTEQIMADLKRGVLSQILRYRTLRKDGSYVWVEATVAGYVDPETNATAGYVATIRDISAVKLREETIASEYRQLSAVAALDELTGIANRRTFNRTLEMEVRRQTRPTRALAVLLLDVDCFKQFNDRYGHLSGDECLRKIAATLKSSVHREADLVARFGGEEFVVLMPMTDAAGAREVASNILRAVASMAIPHQNSPHGIVTVSIGVACWPSGTPINQARLLEQADQALYRAKERGRNNLQVAEEAEGCLSISPS